MNRSPLPYPARNDEPRADGDRPRLLVSVRDAREVEEALAGGADWIDLKEPSRGALGAVDEAAARAVVALVAGRAPVSAAGGELGQWHGSEARALLNVAGVSHLKLGLADCRGTSWAPLWEAARVEANHAGKELVAVAYADAQTANSPPPEEVLEAIDGAACRWILFDTFDKQSGPLLDHLDGQRLRDLLAAAAANGMRTVAAGKLGVESLDKLPLELIDMVGVRGAACRAERESAICAQRVRRLREALDARRCGEVGASEPARLPAPSGAAFFGS